MKITDYNIFRIFIKEYFIIGIKENIIAWY